MNTNTLTPTAPTMSDFPKVYCPFIRQTFNIDKDDFKKHGVSLKLKKPEVYLVVNRINPGYEWVFDDPDTIAVEKLDGSNIKIHMEKGRLIALQNRLQVLDPQQIVKGKIFLLEGVINSAVKEMVPLDGEHAGELIGPKLQGNPYKLDKHEWYPFAKAITDLKYKSFHEHERNFDNWSAWFKDNLYSRYFTKRASKLGLDEKLFAEGVIFYNLRRRAEQKSWMAKLRRDMFDWYYSDKVKIFDYKKEGRNEEENQENFD